MCLQAGRQGRADTLQVRPCKLAVAFPGDTTVGTTLPASLSIIFALLMVLKTFSHCDAYTLAPGVV